MFTAKAAQLVKFVWRATASTEADAHRRRSSLLSLTDAMQVHITPEIFDDLLNQPKFQQILRELDIADEEQLDLFDTLDVDGGGTIDLEELVQGIAKLRGDARRSDIVGVALMVRSLQDSIVELEQALTSQMRAHGKALLEV